MANYPFKINITKGNGDQVTFYTSSFATDADALVSVHLQWININDYEVEYGFEKNN